MDLFDHAHQKRMEKEAPLAARMRPRRLEEFVGQEDIVGEGRLLRRAIESDRLFSSIILWGPPGTGKTSLAMILMNTIKSKRVDLNIKMTYLYGFKIYVKFNILRSLRI